MKRIIIKKNKERRKENCLQNNVENKAKRERENKRKVKDQRLIGKAEQTKIRSKEHKGNRRVCIKKKVESKGNEKKYTKIH